MTVISRHASMLVAGAAVAILACATAGAASATVIPVTSIADDLTNDQACTLREAVAAANTNTAINPAGGEDCPAGQPATQDTIAIGDLGSPGADTIAINGDLELSASNGGVLVDGQGPGSTTVDANGTGRVFQVDSAGPVTIRDLTAREGNPGTGPGGGIIAPFAALTLINVVVSGNTVDGATPGDLNGAGIHLSEGSLTMSDSRVSGNVIDATAGGETLFRGAGIFLGATAGASITRSTITANTINGSPEDVQILRGAGIATNDSQDPIVISDSTIDNNSLNGTNSTREGGGIAWVGAFGSDELLISNSTFGENVAGRGGALFTQRGIASIAFTTFGPNQAPEGGAGLFFDDCCGGSARLRGTLFETGTSSDCDEDGQPTSLGFNVEKGADGTADDDCSLDQPSDALTNQALLSTGLSNSPGPTRTYTLSGLGPSIDIAPAASCLDADGTALNADQRGFPRPVELDGDGVPECDAGGYERVFCTGFIPNALGTNGDDSITGTAGSDIIAGLEGEDTINPAGSVDLACGGGGDDLLRGAADANATDTYVGEAGSDTYQLFNYLDPATIDLASGTASGPGLGAEGLQSIENATGGVDDDVLTGSGGPNVLDGFLGNDVIAGGGGADILLGNAGDDVIFARDGAADTVDCGPGIADSAQTDRPSLDTTVGCESVDALPEPPPQGTPTPTRTGKRAAALKKCKKKRKKAKRRKCRKRARKLPL